MSEPAVLMSLLTEEFDAWCAETGNPGGVSRNDVISAAAMMGDLHHNGILLVSEAEARATLRQLIADLNEKALYAQNSSMLPQLTKGMPTAVKVLILVLLVGALVALLVLAEHVAAGEQAALGTAASSAVYRIA